MSDFDALQSTIKHYPHRLVFYGFDLLQLDGVDLRARPLVERRQKLARLIASGCFAIRYSEPFEGDGVAFFAAAVKHGLEGIVSKRAMSPIPKWPVEGVAEDEERDRERLRPPGARAGHRGLPFCPRWAEGEYGFEYAGVAS